MPKLAIYGEAILAGHEDCFLFFTTNREAYKNLFAADYYGGNKHIPATMKPKALIAHAVCEGYPVWTFGLPKERLDIRMVDSPYEYLIKMSGKLSKRLIDNPPTDWEFNGEGLTYKTWMWRIPQKYAPIFNQTTVIQPKPIDVAKKSLYDLALEDSRKKSIQEDACRPIDGPFKWL